MPDTRTLRRDFRNRLLADAARMMGERLGQVRPGVRIVDVQFMLGTDGTPLLGGEHAFVRLGLNGPSTVMNWSLAGTIARVPAAGTVTVDVLNGTTMLTLGSICGAARPSLTGQSERSDQDPTGWSLDIPDPSWLMARITAVDGVLEVVGLTLRVAVGVAPTTRFITDDTGEFIVDDNGVPLEMEF